MADLSLAYRKTAAGAEELASKALGLSREHRNLLIVADGRHALSVYCKAVGCDPDKLSSLADGLLQLGLIEASSERPPAAQAPADAGASAPARIDPVALKPRILEIANAVFGGEGKSIIQKLEKAEGSAGELMAAVESAAKLAKLTIDETRANAFVAEARKALGL